MKTRKRIVSASIAITLCGLLSACVSSEFREIPGVFPLTFEITSTPPGAEIWSVPHTPQYFGDMQYNDFAYTTMGNKPKRIGPVTPCAMGITANIRASGSADWEFNEYYYGGNSLALLKHTSQKIMSGIWIYHEHTVELEFMLKLDGYQSEIVKVPIGVRQPSFSQLLQNAGRHPISVHRILTPL